MDHLVSRRWMYSRFLPESHEFSRDFLDGVVRFIEFACTQTSFIRNQKLRCPCNKCRNLRFYKPDEVHEHLLRRGFISDYWYWTEHGECQPDDNNNIADTSTSSAPFDHIQNNYESMIFDAMGRRDFEQFYQNNEDDGTVNVEEPPNEDTQHFYDMLSLARRPLWPGCETHSELSMAVQMMSLKSEHHMSQSCFNGMTSLLQQSNPSGNCVLESFYDTKKLIKKIGLTSIRYDCCINGCMLYYKDDEELAVCKFCGHNRFKRSGNNKMVPYARTHYLPLIPRLRRLYASLQSAEHMRWHYENKRAPGVLVHPSDGIAWKHFDYKHPDFAKEPRNVRLGLCADGFNPFSQSATPYSLWPVILTPYNLPPALCMTTPYMFFTCLIPGPHNPKSRIDVYLQPLIDELNVLWECGVDTYDVSKKQNFRMRAALLWTINDFPAYGMLGWMTAGKLACPICMRQTKSFRLVHGKKMSWFDCHRQFLHTDHPFRKNRDAFSKGRIERSMPPARLSGNEVWEQVRFLPKITDVPSSYGKLPGYRETHN